MNAITIETPRGYTIKKERSAGKIDGLIALAMAMQAAMVHGPSSSMVPWAGGRRVVSMRDWADQGDQALRSDREPAPGTITVHIGGGRVGSILDW